MNKNLIPLLGAALSVALRLSPLQAQQAPWKMEWEKTLEAARKEGQVNVYITTWGPVLQSGLFEKSYPGIKIVVIAGPAPDITQRVLAERRAGKYLADLSSGGLNPNLLIFHARKMLDPIKPALVLPEVVDEPKWWQGKHHYVDPERQYVSSIPTPRSTGRSASIPSWLTSVSSILSPTS